MSEGKREENIEPVYPKFGFAIASEEPTMMLCKPKLLPIQSYSYIKMQLQAKNQINTESSRNTDRPK